MKYGPLSLSIGIASLAVGIVAIVAPDVIPLSPDRLIVTLLGVVALGQSIRVIQRRRRGAIDEATTPDPERRIATPQPGKDIESVLAQFLDRHRIHLPVHWIRNGLTAVTVEVLTRFEGRTRSDAIAQIEAGTWTGDLYAAAFLGGTDTPRPPLRSMVRSALASESKTQRRVRHTVGAIAAVVEKHTGSNKGTTTTGRPGNTEDGTANDAESDRAVPQKTGASVDAKAEEITDGVPHSTGHWRGVSVIALIGIGIGVILEQPAVLLGGVVGVGYAAYAQSRIFSPGRVAIDRKLDTKTAAVGDTVTVTITVTNRSNRILPDIRIVDGVPEALSVDSGSPRCGMMLRPTERSEFSYTVTARRGVHEFGQTQVIGRNLAGEIESERLYTSETTLTCIPSLAIGTEPIPLRRSVTQFAGHENTPTRGEGIEFSATREYRPGDPMRRIDWNRHARTRELTTIEFREERASTVVLLVDARASAYVGPDPEGVHAVDRSVEAAGQLFTQLCDASNRVGIAAVGSASCWLAPDTGVEHRRKARELLAVDPALSSVPKNEQFVLRRWQQTLLGRLEPGTQIVYLSPLCDETATRIARQLDEHGIPVTVVSPDPTGERSPGHQLAGVARQLRISTLRGAEVSVIEWAWTEPLDSALVRYNQRRVQ